MGQAADPEPQVTVDVDTVAQVQEKHGEKLIYKHQEEEFSDFY